MSENPIPTGGALRSSKAAANEIPNEQRRHLYEYVAERGPVRHRRLREALFPNDRRAARHHLALLERSGFLVEEDDRVRVAVDIDRLTEAKTVDLPRFDSPVELRPANESDRTALVDVMRSVGGERIHVDAVATAAPLAHGGRLHRRGAEGERGFYVATVDKTVCGWVHAEAPSRPESHHATITGGVVEERREAGIGTNLLEYAQTWAERCGYEKLYQHLPSTNRVGVDFLTNRGWTVEATRSDHYLAKDSYTDEVILSCAIDD
ncbi:GNAT family N-acetyltransferase [Halostella pelagica]|uniref:GNAT family N-acetyltransferase n=1 Tax=Halostella pelagica TaxID=2583824 RepID=UPI00107FD80B|nr:GNAT family N-acetyltransferase [Halostella pelagica]